MARVLSGIQPTGDIPPRELPGRPAHWVDDQHEHDSFYCVVDLHALTVEHDPAELRAKTLEIARCCWPSGLDPDVCTLFVQSHVPEHTELTWLLECTATLGELRRMTQFKDKSARAEESVPGSACSPTRC